MTRPLQATLLAVLCALTVCVQAQTPPAEGEKAFMSFTDLAVGGTWIRDDDNQIQHSYEWSVGRKFVQLTAKGGSRPFVAMIGVDPKSGQCTWWFFHDDGSLETGTLEQTGDGVWKLEVNGEGVTGPTSYKGKSSRVDQDTVETQSLPAVADFVACGISGMPACP
jgi:hypothetical protein